MPSKKRKYETRFPPARIKKIMQTNEEIGKVAGAVPIIISRSLEIFLQSLVETTADYTNARKAKTMTTSHLKHCIENEKKFDFLKELVSNIADISNQDEEESNDAVEKPKKQRKPRAAAGERKKRKKESSSDPDDSDALSDDESSSKQAINLPSDTSNINPTTPVLPSAPQPLTHSIDAIMGTSQQEQSSTDDVSPTDDLVGQSSSTSTLPNNSTTMRMMMTSIAKPNDDEDDDYDI